MSRTLNRRAALGAGLATLMPAPTPAGLFATTANVALGPSAATALPVSLDAVAVVSEVAARATLETAPALRSGGEAMPDHAALWRRMPLPFTPAEAWRLLSPDVQEEVGAAVIGMHLAQYVHGDSMAEADCFLDGDLRDAADDVQSDILNRMDDRLWGLFPDLYGPDGDHPRWALDNGMVVPLPP